MSSDSLALAVPPDLVAEPPGELPQVLRGACRSFIAHRRG
jgi:hypothetical protein